MPRPEYTEANRRRKKLQKDETYDDNTKFLMKIKKIHEKLDYHKSLRWFILFPYLNEKVLKSKFLIAWRENLKYLKLLPIWNPFRIGISQFLQRLLTNYFSLEMIICHLYKEQDISNIFSTSIFPKYIFNESHPILTNCATRTLKTIFYS